MNYLPLGLSLDVEDVLNVLAEKSRLETNHILSNALSFKNPFMGFYTSACQTSPESSSTSMYDQMLSIVNSDNVALPSYSQQSPSTSTGNVLASSKTVSSSIAITDSMEFVDEHVLDSEDDVPHRRQHRKICKTRKQRGTCRSKPSPSSPHPKELKFVEYDYNKARLNHKKQYLTTMQGTTNNQAIRVFKCYW